MERPEQLARGAWACDWCPACRENPADAAGVVMRSVERRVLTDLRQALIPLHRTLLEWERTAYERVHGRTGAAEMLKVIVGDPQFAWLRPLSDLIARIDSLLDQQAPDTLIDLDAFLNQTRVLVAPDENGSPYARKYYAALQDVPDVVFAHRRVTAVLRDAPSTPETLH